MPVIVKYSDELYHHGIPNMKWGRRRFQNEDGSLTPAGRIRYGVGEKQNRKFSDDDISNMEKVRKERIQYNKLRTREMKKVAKGRTSGMSDRDIASYNERLAKEADRMEQSNRHDKAKQQRKINAMKASLEVVKTTTGLILAGAALKSAITKNSKPEKEDSGDKKNGQNVEFQYNKTVNKAPFVQFGGNKKKKKGGD